MDEHGYNVISRLQDCLLLHLLIPFSFLTEPEVLRFYSLRIDNPLYARLVAMGSISGPITPTRGHSLFEFRLDE